MANPFTEPSPSNYNDNPPPDNGVETDANEITWAGIKTKLADPIYNWLSSTLTNITSAFGKIFLNSVSSVSSNYTIQSSDQGKLLNCTNTITVTLLPAATVGSNFNITIRNNGSGTVTVDGDGAETINGSATLSLGPGAYAILSSNGSAYFALEGSVTRSGTETLTNKTLTSPTVNTPTVSSPTITGTISGSATVGGTITVPFARFGVLPTRETITTSPTTGSWVTVDNSTLATAQASVAILGVRIGVVANSAFTGSNRVFFRKTGTSLSNSASESQFAEASSSIGDTSTTTSDLCFSIAFVELDSNYDFDYYVQQSGGSSYTTEIYLIGYFK